MKQKLLLLVMGLFAFAGNIQADDVDITEDQVESIMPDGIIPRSPYAPIVLDDTNTDLPEETWDPEDVIVKRRVKAGVWSTLCLPFLIPSDQLKEIFGDGVMLAEFDGTEIDDNNSRFLVKFETVDVEEGLNPNYPYLIKSENELSEFTVRDVLIFVHEEEAYNGVEVNYDIFRGTLKKGTYTPEDGGTLVYIKDNKFYYNEESIEMNAFRGYFEFCNYNPDLFSNTIFSFDGEPTEIEGLNINGHEIVSGDVYNVMGVNMGRAEKVMDNLPRGIYIVNSKKVLVK